MNIKKRMKLLSHFVMLAVLTGCQDESISNSLINSEQIGSPKPQAKLSVESISTEELISEAWFSNLGQTDMVAAAKVAGYYAAADSGSSTIEIRDISSNLLHTVTASDIELAGLSSAGQLCGMTFTPSGRFLYMALCSQGSEEDAILAFNTNTGVLSVFDRVKLRSDPSNTRHHFGMAYFKSKLYVGSDQGVYRYEASRNTVYNGGTEPEIGLIATPSPVKDIALDMVGGNLYVLTQNGVFKLPADGEQLTKVYNRRNLSRIGYSRVFGRKALAGLYITKDTQQSSQVFFVPKGLVEQGGDLTNAATELWSYDGKLVDLTTTPDGKLLYSGGDADAQYGNAYTLTDSGDVYRLTYQQWLRDELAQYVAAIKSLTAYNGSEIDGTNSTTLSPEGFLHRKLQRAGLAANETPIADTVGWAIYLLMAANEANMLSSEGVVDESLADQQIQPLLELLIERHAGLIPDGTGGIKTVDGHFVRNYNSDGTPFAKDQSPGPQPQVYTSMKFLPAVIKAAELYPESKKIAEAKKYLEQIFVRSADTIRARQGVTWEVDDFGPVRNANGMANESWIYGDLGAAQDPMASYNYGQYVYERDNFSYDHWLEGEPVIKPSHAAFVVMGGTLVLKHHADDAGWKEQNNNYYALTQAVTDDLGSPYFAAFSAGNNPFDRENKNGNYWNDGPSDHPGDIIHFPAVLGFGQHGKLGAMVGGYFAYRDGLRQDMLNSSDPESSLKMLTRWSMVKPDYEMPSIGIADFWFGAVGLAETIRPGTADKLRNTFFRAHHELSGDDDGNQVVLFSALTPRHVIGVRDDNSEQSFGFQRSPFTVPGRQHFATFKIEDPQGDWIELDDVVSAKEQDKYGDFKAPRFTNPDFENEVAGWQYFGDGKTRTVKGASGQGVRIRTSSTGESVLTQAVLQPVSLENSQYKVSAFIKPIKVTEATAFIRTYWSAEGDRNAPLGEVTVSDSIGTGEAGQLVAVYSYKPEGAAYLHIEYVVSGHSEVVESFMFDNTSLQLVGTLAELDNGDFESSSDGIWAGGINTNKASVIAMDAEDEEGRIYTNHALEFVLNGTTSWQTVETGSNIDISADPDGTRYIFKFDVLENTLRSKDDLGNDPATEFDIDVDVLPKTSESKKSTRPYAATVESNSKNEIAFVMRKRPGDEQFNIVLKVRQRSKNVGEERVVIDNLRVYKQRLFLECDTTSATGC
ncbi:hypothetical protein [Photobacterium satsumensis]|uniref:hypothetical protein n=1 Tax=Photobacterium satsumensis TaxID=2910239 RepID=UPI003D0A8C5D